MSARRFLALTLAAAALLLAAGVLVVTGMEAYRLYWPQTAAATPPVASANRPVEPIEPLEPIASAALTSPEPDAPSRFVWLPTLKPRDFCATLGAIGLGHPDFQHGEGAVEGWACVADLLKPTPGEDGRVSSLFVSARGLDIDRLDGFRIKLNLIDPATAPAVRAGARDMLARIFAALGWRTPDAAAEALDQLRPGHIEHRGVAFDLSKEFGGAERFNLVIGFPERLGAGGTERFVPQPRSGGGPG